jgi:DNA-binding transcriptional MerR regulator
MTWTIAEVARMSKITARTLRYYDQIGLLPPTGVGPGGVRLYGEPELLRLQRVMLLRDLGLGLNVIASVLDEQDRRGTEEVLARHRDWLLRESERLAQLAATVQNTLDSIAGGIGMRPEELFEGFDHARYEAEANERWPEQAAEARRRTAGWKPEDYKEAGRKSVDLARRFAALAEQGVPSDDPRAQVAVAEHYDGICRFWTPNAAAYAGLGEMYVADERFRQYYDEHGAGTAQYVCDAIAVYAEANLA